MSLLQELATKGLISQEQITEIIRVANEKYGGDVDSALVDAGIDHFCG